MPENQEGGKKKQTAWMKHLMAYYKAHKGSKTFTECMKEAKKTYKK